MAAFKVLKIKISGNLYFTIFLQQPIKSSQQTPEIKQQPPEEPEDPGVPSEFLEEFF